MPVIKARYALFMPSIGEYMIGSNTPEKKLMRKGTMTAHEPITVISGLTPKYRHIVVGTAKKINIAKAIQIFPIMCDLRL